MGCGSSKSFEDPEAARRNDQIEAELRRDKQALKNEVKILFLGAGESGKTTVMRQMRIINHGTWTDAEREEFRDVIFNNTVQSMQVVIDALDLLQIEVPPHLVTHTKFLLSLGDHPAVSTPSGDLDKRIVGCIRELWAFTGAKEAVEMSHEFQLNDSAGYFFDAVERIGQTGYVPTDQDILRSRVKTTGITEVTFTVKSLKYRCFDVGGQRSERKKWVHCFEDVQILIFIVAISEYNQMLYEDESVSRMVEATTLWDSIANSRWFTRTSIILFLNKIDLFQAKLPMHKFSDYVPEYQGDNSYTSTTAYLESMFRSLYRNDSRELFTHKTCATDTGSMSVVLSAVLVVPVHPIKRAKFEQYAASLRRQDVVPLRDVPADPRGDRAIFSSSSTTAGALLLHFQTPTTYASSHELDFLSEFQLHRRVHAVIGVLDATETSSTLTEAVSSFHHALKDLPVTTAAKAVAFDATEGQLEEVRKVGEREGMVAVPRDTKDDAVLKRIMADFCGGILREFSNLAAQFESRSHFATPQQESGAPTPFSYITTKPNAKAAIATYASPKAPIAVPPPPVNVSNLGIAPPPQSRTAQGLWGGSTSGNQDGFLYGQSIASNVALQPGSAPSPPPGASVVDSKTRKKLIGREKKLLGDMWLLAGRLNRAIECYNEAITLNKAWSDQVWQASAFEGLAVALVVQAWLPASLKEPASTNATTIASTSTGGPSDVATLSSSVPDKLSQAINLYAKMLLPASRADNSPLDPDRCHPVLYAEACLRCARFLAALWESNGAVDAALERLCGAAPRTDSSSPADRSRQAKLKSLSPANNTSRSTIASWISLAYCPQLALLNLPTRLRITGEIATMFAKIGYRRKEAVVVRELTALCAEGVAGASTEIVQTAADQPLSPIGETAEDGSADATVNGNATATATRSRRKVASGLRTTVDSAGNESVIRLAEALCKAYGITPAPVVDHRQQKRRSYVQGRPFEFDAAVATRKRWPQLQVGVLRDVIRVAEQLSDYQAAVRFTVTALRALSETMPPADQYEMSQSIPRIFAAATRRGVAFELEYWGPMQLIMSLEVAQLLPNRRVYENIKIARKSSIAAADSTAPRYIYNPNKLKATAKTKPTLVQNDLMETFVTLQNPFMFDLEIEAIELSTSGAAFDADVLSTVVSAGSFQTVRLTGTPREAGNLQVRGCYVRLAGCSSREFLLPVFSAADEEKRKKALALTSSQGRIKKSGLDAFGEADEEPSTGQVPSSKWRFVECVVVEEMPLLWTRSTSLTHGALMLYDGEVTTIKLDVENSSKLALEYLTLTFTDMHSENVLKRIEEEELSPGEVYELEQDVTNRPVFSWDNQEDVQIPTGGKRTIEVKCLGKAGCGSGRIQIDYAAKGPDPSSKGAFYTRQLSLDVFMTVHRPLVTSNLGITLLEALPTPATANGHHTRSESVVHLGKRGAAIDHQLEDSLRDVEFGEHVLISVDIMNVYGAPFDVVFGTSGGRGLETKQRLEPGATERMLVRLDRFTLPKELARRPIPLNEERQFVVAKEQASEEEEAAKRELLWYRQELLNRLRASWSEIGSLRSGTIVLRDLELTSAMLDVLKADDVSIELSLLEEPDVPVKIVGQGRRVSYDAPTDCLLTVRAVITNNSDTPVDLEFSLVHERPYGVGLALFRHLSQYVLIQGASHQALDRLEPGASVERLESVLFLSQGNFELGALVKTIAGTGETEQGTRTKSWVCRERLVVNVV